MKPFFMMILARTLFSTAGIHYQIEVPVSGKLKEDVYVIRLSDIKDPIEVNMFQFFNDISYIKLESKIDNKLGKVKWIIGNKYLVGYDRGMGFVQFSSDGKFIRKFANYGKGPQEVYYPIWAVSRDESHIYIYDFLKPKYFLCFNLNSGSFEKNIPIPIEGEINNLYFVNDSTLICAPIVGNGKPAGNYCLFWQTLSGRLLKALPARTISKPVVLSGNILYRVGNSFHYRPLYSDTIFQVNNYTMDPYIVFKGTSRQGSNVGSNNFEIFLETPEFLVVNSSIIKSKESIDENTVGYNTVKKDYLINKITKKMYVISNVSNDQNGLPVYPSSMMDLISPQKYISMEATEFIRTITRLKKDPTIKIKDRNKIMDLGSNMTESDNPVLIIDAKPK
jgi:hypothetical protein